MLDEAKRAEQDGAWEKAADALQRYLLFRPDDADALARYGRALEHLPNPERNRPRAIIGSRSRSDSSPATRATIPGRARFVRYRRNRI